MPRHNHLGTTDRPGTHRHYGLYTNFNYQIRNDDGNNTQIGGQSWSTNNIGVVMSINDNGYIFTGTVGDHSHNITFESRGSGVPFNKLPPYYVVAFLIYEG